VSYNVEMDPRLDHIPYVTVRHANLRRLTCTGRCLYGLTLPNLEYLSVWALRQSTDVENFTSFLCAPHPFLQHLVAEGRFDKSAISTFAWAIQHLPSIKVLDITYCTYPDEDGRAGGPISLHSIMLAPATAVDLEVLPKLDAIFFAVENEEDIDPNVKVLESRFKAGNTSLREVKVSSFKFGFLTISEAIIARLERIGVTTIYELDDLGLGPAVLIRNYRPPPEIPEGFYENGLGLNELIGLSNYRRH
jgi:hypothetical protein